MRLPRGGCRFPGVGTALALGLGLALASPGLADVVDATPDSFTVQTVYEVEASPTQVYQAFVGNIGSWWHPDHTFSGEARNMSIDAAPSGCLCEKLPAGGIRHLTVVYVEAGKMIRLVGGLGPLQAEAVSGSMTWSFEPQDGGTQLSVTYKVSGSAGSKLDEWAPAVDGVLSQAAGRLVRFVTTGSAE